MKLSILTLITCLLMTGCATTGGYDRMMKSWLEATEEELIDSWGPPDKFYQVNQHKRVLTYERSGSALIPGQQPTYQSTKIGGTTYTNAFGGRSPALVNLRCTTTFNIVDGIIKYYEWNGNACGS